MTSAVSVLSTGDEWGIFITKLEHRILAFKPGYTTMKPYYLYGERLVYQVRTQCSLGFNSPNITSEPRFYTRACGKIRLTKTNHASRDPRLYTRILKTKKQLEMRWVLASPHTKFAMNVTFVRVSLTASLFNCHLESLRYGIKPSKDPLNPIWSKPACGDQFQYEHIETRGLTVLLYTKNFRWYFETRSFLILYQVATQAERRTHTIDHFISANSIRYTLVELNTLSRNQYDTVYLYLRGMSNLITYLSIYFGEGLWDCLELMVHDGPTLYAPTMQYFSSGKYTKLSLQMFFDIISTVVGHSSFVNDLLHHTFSISVTPSYLIGREVVVKTYLPTAFHISAGVSYKPESRPKCMFEDKKLYFELASVDNKNERSQQHSLPSRTAKEFEMNETLTLRMPLDGCIDKGHVIFCYIMIHLKHPALHNIHLTISNLDIAEPNTLDCDYAGLQIFDNPTEYADQFVYPSVLCRKYYVASQDKYLFPVTEYFTRDNVVHLIFHSYTMGVRNGRSDGVSIRLEASKCQGIHHTCQKTHVMTNVLHHSTDTLTMIKPGKISSDCMIHTDTRHPILNFHQYLQRPTYKLCRMAAHGNTSYMTNYIPYENTECLRIQYHPRFQPREDNTKCGSSIVVSAGNNPVINLNSFQDSEKIIQIFKAPLVESPDMSLEVKRTDYTYYIQGEFPKNGYFNLLFNKAIGQEFPWRFFDDPTGHITWMDTEYSRSFLLTANKIEHRLSRKSFHLSHWGFTAKEYLHISDDYQSRPNDSKWGAKL